MYQCSLVCPIVLSMQTKVHISGGALSHCTVDTNRSTHQWRLAVPLYCRCKQKYTSVAARCPIVLSIQTEVHISGGSLSHCTVDTNRSTHQWRLAVPLYCRLKTEAHQQRLAVPLTVDTNRSTHKWRLAGLYYGKGGGRIVTLLVRMLKETFISAHPLNYLLLVHTAGLHFPTILFKLLRGA
jgi:hypothetical protein